jgi:hypothetical protein
MTVDTAPLEGELLITEDEAQQITSRIREWVKAFLVEDVKRAYEGRIWITMGYDSWAEWCDCELNGFKLPVVERREVVAELTDAGMSQRAIPDVVDVSQSTVRDDLQVSRNHSPESGWFSDEQEAADCMAMADVPDDEFEVVLAEARAQDDLSGDNVVALCRNRIGPTIGLDGKTYTKHPTPVRSRRRPLTDDTTAIAIDLRRILKRLEKLLDDDRFADNRESIGNTIRPDVAFGLDILGRLDREINLSGGA